MTCILTGSVAQHAKSVRRRCAVAGVCHLRRCSTHRTCVAGWQRHLWWMLKSIMLQGSARKAPIAHKHSSRRGVTAGTVWSVEFARQTTGRRCKARATSEVPRQTLGPVLELLTAVKRIPTVLTSMSSATHAMVSSAMQPRFTAGERDYVSPQISRINYTRRSRTLAAPALQKRALSTLIIPNARRPTSRGSATVVSMSSDKEAITAVLNKYEAALNESSTDKVRPDLALLHSRGHTLKRVMQQVLVCQNRVMLISPAVGLEPYQSICKPFLKDVMPSQVMELYAPNGVFMPQHSPSSEGTAAVKKAYDFVFEMLTLAVKFKVRRLLFA